MMNTILGLDAFPFVQEVVAQAADAAANARSNSERVIIYSLIRPDGP